MDTDLPRTAPPGPPSAALRYGIAFVLLFYGFAKINGSQFTILDSELDKPMRDVSGFWLTWYYFGYSPIYGNLIALAQVGGALLLTFRRTALLGACILLPLVTNIVLVNVFYGIDPDAFVVSLLLWWGLLVILLRYREPLLALFWGPPAAPAARGHRAKAWAVRAGMVVFAAAFTWWVANFNNRAPTPLDGRWDVAAAPGLRAEDVPARIYFERNRAHMAVFRYAGSAATHHFEVDPERRTIGIWEQWLAKGAPRFSGSYALAADTLLLSGRLEGYVQPVTLRLTRVRD